MTADEVIRVLLDNGFILDHQRGSHRVYFNAQTGKRAIVPFHRRDLPKGTLLAILKQAGLSKEDL
jgi:predicted RNA binding protein YcfA (HicA-like mRNA interferase family)